VPKKAGPAVQVNQGTYFSMGAPYPVEVVKGSGGHILTLTNWNRGMGPTPPAERQDARPARPWRSGRRKREEPHIALSRPTVGSGTMS
jgi:hypothetical protein